MHFPSTFNLAWLKLLFIQGIMVPLHHKKKFELYELQISKLFSKYMHLRLYFSSPIPNEDCKIISLRSSLSNTHDIRTLWLFLLPWYHHVNFFLLPVAIINIHFKRTMPNNFHFILFKKLHLTVIFLFIAGSIILQFSI